MTIYTLHKPLLSKPHITQKSSLAQVTLSNLYRFRNALPSTKRHLFLALVYPLLTYCPLALSLSAHTNRLKLQRIQNKALRFIHNTKWDDFKTNETLHNDTRRPPLNIAWHHKLMKQLHKFTITHPDVITDLTNIATCRFNRPGRTLINTDAHPDQLEPTFK